MKIYEKPLKQVSKMRTELSKMIQSDALEDCDYIHSLSEAMVALSLFECRVKALIESKAQNLKRMRGAK